MRFRLADFDWFTKKSKVGFGRTYVVCSDAASKIDQKVIIPLKQFGMPGRHVTVSLSKRYFEAHLTSEENDNKYSSIVRVECKDMTRCVRKNKVQIYSSYRFIPCDSKPMGLIFVEPTSREFLPQGIDYMRNGIDIHPRYLLKLCCYALKSHIRQTYRHHAKQVIRCQKKLIFVYDVFGRFRGIARCNHRKQGYDMFGHTLKKIVFRDLIDLNNIRETLIGNGLPYNPKRDRVWDTWLLCIGRTEILYSYFRCRIKKIFVFKIN